MLRASSYSSNRSRYGYGTNTDTSNAKIFSSPSATLWTSPLIPPALVGPFFGRGAAHLKQLKSAFPALYIDFQKHTDPDLADHFRFSLSRNTRNVLRWSAADDSQLDECKQLILECLKCTRYAFHTRLTHALPVQGGARAEMPVKWKQLGEEYVAMAAEVDVNGPLYVLADVAMEGEGHADLNELSKLLETLDIGTERKGKLAHHQAYTDADLLALSARIVTTYTDLARVYTTRSDRIFTLSATLGSQVFGHDFVRGRLQHALPTDTTPALSFKLADLEQALQEREVKPSFSEVLPLGVFAEVVDALKGLGYSVPRAPAGAGTTATDDDNGKGMVEKVAVTFTLDQDYLDHHLKQSSLPGYTPRFEYKATFVYDHDQDRFILSEKGCRLRNHRIVRHTWVELVSPGTVSPNNVHAVMPRLKFGITRPNDRPRGWDLANDLLGHMSMYINANLAGLRGSAAEAAATLTPLPSSLKYPLSQFRLRHKLVTSLDSRSLSDYHVSVKRVTMWYRFNDPTGELTREAMREKTWDVPERQPAFVSVLLVDNGVGVAEQAVGGGVGEREAMEAGRKMVEQRVIKFGKEVERVAQAVRTAVMV